MAERFTLLLILLARKFIHTPGACSPRRKSNSQPSEWSKCVTFFIPSVPACWLPLSDWTPFAADTWLAQLAGTRERCYVFRPLRRLGIWFSSRASSGTFWLIFRGKVREGPWIFRPFSLINSVSLLFVAIPQLTWKDPQTHLTPHGDGWVWLGNVVRDDKGKTRYQAELNGRRVVFNVFEDFFHRFFFFFAAGLFYG